MRARAVRFLGVLAAAAALGWPAPASAVRFDLTGGGDFGPTGTEAASLSQTLDGLTLTLSALTMIPEGDPSLSGGTAGVVHIGEDGAGVRAGLGVGSKAISGKGAHAEEALTLVFSAPVVTSTLRIALADFDLEKSKKSKKSKKWKKRSKRSRKSKKRSQGDRLLVYADSPLQPALSEEATLDLLSRLGDDEDDDELTLLSLLDPSLPATLTSLTLRAPGGHFFVSEVHATLVPEPGTAALIGLGLAALGVRRARPRRRSQSRWPDS